MQKRNEGLQEYFSNTWS